MLDEMQLNRLRSTVSAVNWEHYRDASGEFTNLSGLIMRVALDQLKEEERRKFGTILYVRVANQGSLGQVSSHVTKVLNLILRDRLYVNADLIYQVLVALMEGWGNEGDADEVTREIRPYWMLVRKEIYANFDTYTRDLADFSPTKVRSLIEFLSLLAPRFPEVVDKLEKKAIGSNGTERGILISAADDARELISESAADERYSI